MSTQVITAAASPSTHPTHVPGVAGASGRPTSRGRTIAVGQAARRTGLSDSAEGMVVVCSRNELPVEMVGGRGYIGVEVFASAFLGAAEAAVPVELGEVVLLESGRL